MANSGKIAIWVIVVLPIWGQRFTIPDRQAPQAGSAQVELLGRRLPASLAPAVLAPGHTALVFADSVSTERLPETVGLLKRYWTAAKDKKSFLVVLVQAGEANPFGPFRSLADLDKQLQPLLRRPDDVPQPATQPLTFHEMAFRFLPEGGDTWTRLTWVATVPDLPELIRDYAAARLGRALGERRLLLRIENPETETPAWLNALAAEDGAQAELTWDHPAAGTGFETARIKLLREDGPAESERPVLLVAPGVELPSLARYHDLLAAMSALRSDPANPAQLRALMEALPANPLERRVLEAGSAAAVQQKDWRVAVALLEGLTKLSPDDPGLAASLANAAYERGPLREARVPLSRALELSPKDALLLERAGRVRLEVGERAEAAGFFDRSLESQPRNETLLWIRADLAKDMKDAPAERSALGRALALNPSRLDRRSRLIRLSLDAKDIAAARASLEPVWRDLPAEVPELSTFAGYWEEAGDPGKALELWRRCTGVDANHEPAYASMARLLLAAKQPDEALKAAEAGIAKAPDAARLHVFRADALLTQDRVHEARRALAEPAARLKDVALLERYARLEDQFAEHAAPAYRRWAEAVGESASGAAARTRGAVVALRDGDVELSAWFLGKKPQEAKPAGFAPEKGAVIPGGIQALATVARTRESVTINDFLAEYCRTVGAASMHRNEKEWQLYQQSIIDHFQRIAKLRTWGQTKDGVTNILLSLSSKNDRKKTSDILEFLGYRLKNNKDKTTIEAGEKGTHADRQLLLPALSVDEVAMRESLSAGKPFQLVIRDDVVPVLLTQEPWQKEFFGKLGGAGGMAVVVLNDPRVARLYSGLEAAGEASARLLVGAIGLRTLAEKFADHIFIHGPSLAVIDGKPNLPGGPATAPIWQAIAGVPPSQTARFLQALLNTNDGRMLAFYSTLSSLTPDRQRFYTRSVERTKQYYTLLAESPEMKHAAEGRVRRGAVADFMRSVPLDETGSVRFAGSPEVWQVVRGQSSVNQTAKLLKKAAKATLAEEDDILSRLVRQQYDSGAGKVTLVENFLAISRIDQRRPEPLTPAEALMLSQKYAFYPGVYPYFESLPGLKYDDFLAFFRLGESWKDSNDAKEQSTAAYFHDVTKILVMLGESGALTATDGAAAFRALCEALDVNAPPANRTKAVAALVRKWKPAASPTHRQFLEDAWLGPEHAVALAGGSPVPEVNPGAHRREEFRAVLSQQKIPDLDEVLRAVDNAAAVAKGPNEALAAATALEAFYSTLPVMELPKNAKLKEPVREALRGLHPQEAPKLLRELRQKAAKKKPNPKEFEALSAELLQDLSGPLELALRGLVYAYYLRPTDLPVTEDAWLVRKHQFISLGSSAKDKIRFQPADFLVSSDGLGSYASGSFANFTHALGPLVLTGQQLGNQHVPLVEGMALVNLRATPFWSLKEEDLRLAHLLVLGGREWIVSAAQNEEARQKLEAASAGLLGSQRKMQLVAGLRTADWQSIWASVSLSELYWLGTILQTSMTDSVGESPVLAGLKRAASTGARSPARLRLLGNVYPEAIGNDIPRLEILPPYEDYAAQMFPSRIAERVAEWKLYLAVMADRAGLEPSTLDVLGEPLLLKACERLEMASAFDWESVLKRFAELKTSWLKEIKIEIAK
jgi:tetratricopeptide (TPR) repeat protein